VATIFVGLGWEGSRHFPWHSLSLLPSVTQVSEGATDMDWIVDVLKVGAAVPTPIALAGFGAACAFLIAFFVVRGITRRTDDRELARLAVKTLYRMFVWTLIAVVVVVLGLSILNARFPVQSGKSAVYTNGTDNDEPTSVSKNTEPPISAAELTADSGWVSGGQDPVSYCNRQQDALQKQHPAARIETVKRYEFPPQKHKNGLGIVTGVSYRYQCWFKAT
jgi:hypothetical protein